MSSAEMWKPTKEKDIAVGYGEGETPEIANKNAIINAEAQAVADAEPRMLSYRCIDGSPSILWVRTTGGAVVDTDEVEEGFRSMAYVTWRLDLQLSE